MFESLEELPAPVPARAPEWIDEFFATLTDEPWTSADALVEATDRPVGAGLLMSLAEVDPATLCADDAVTFAEEVERFAAFAAGFVARARAEAMDRLVDVLAGPAGANGAKFVTPEMLASAELAAALRMAPRTVTAQFEHADLLAGPMKLLRDAMLAGTISAGHASAIARELLRLPAAADPARSGQFTAECARILSVVIPYATRHTPGDSARRTRSLVIVEDPQGSAEQQRDAAEREHGVWLTPTEAGSCEITAALPLGHGVALMDAINALAADERFETSDGCVTAGQRRIAALTTLVLGDPGSVARIEGPVTEAKITAQVNVIVPLESLLTSDTGCAGGVVGGSAVSSEVIRDLVAAASTSSTIRRLVTDSTGCIVDAGRTRYAVSDTQRHLIALRDGTCRFPGCSRAAVRCEIDHATPWDDGGGTDLDNLGPLCKHHHQMKTHGGWRITVSHRSGRCTWRSPLGRVYEHEPTPLVPPPRQSVVTSSETPPF